MLFVTKSMSVALRLFLGDNPCCRFVPSCAEYAASAFRLHGFWKGALLALLRIGRCQPFCRPGLDPVPSLDNSPLRCQP